MDWFGKYRADIKYRKRKVILLMPSKKETTFFGVKSRTVPRAVSAMKTIKMLRKDKCMGFWSTFWETKIGSEC
ncbi:hypothetical protein ACS0TY_010877 [Phlomoides rotata]